MFEQHGHECLNQATELAGPHETHRRRAKPVQVRRALMDVSYQGPGKVPRILLVGRKFVVCLGESLSLTGRERGQPGEPFGLEFIPRQRDVARLGRTDQGFGHAADECHHDGALDMPSQFCRQPDHRPSDLREVSVGDLSFPAEADPRVVLAGVPRPVSEKQRAIARGIVERKRAAEPARKMAATPGPKAPTKPRARRSSK